MLRSRHRRTLEQIFATPTPSDIRWAAVVALMRVLDVEMAEWAGSRVVFKKDAGRIVAHRPHPGPNLDRGQVRSVATFLATIGVRP
jgi:hypothetical protein